MTNTNYTSMAQRIRAKGADLRAAERSPSINA